MILHMRPHRRWLFIVASHTLCKDRFHACHTSTPWFINHEICHNTVNLNSLEINHDHFLSMPSPNFRLSSGSLGYWTACNNFKRYCTLPYCDNGHHFDRFTTSESNRTWSIWLRSASPGDDIVVTMTTFLFHSLSRSDAYMRRWYNHHLFR